MCSRDCVLYHKEAFLGSMNDMLALKQEHTTRTAAEETILRIVAIYERKSQGLIGDGGLKWVQLAFLLHCKRKRKKMSPALNFCQLIAICHYCVRMSITFSFCFFCIYLYL
ncbi:uncharacterized protein LOC119995130 [Tripterygium wilfordii]|uniref:uncharacterized protein LOC119995130 n=1 Tax=Tripterygium wilfordii TaxID=458696 RepID=UPI0018F7F58C|nr:uncharacterized protein LOC119995130 [Tripterygium wilfordii]